MTPWAWVASGLAVIAAVQAVHYFLRRDLRRRERALEADLSAGPQWQHGLGDHEDGGPAWPDYQTYDNEATTAAGMYLDAFRPLRALREVTAKRAILAAYEANDGDVPLHLGNFPRKHGEWDGLRLAVRHLAAVWSNHPDYDPAWKP